MGEAEVALTKLNENDQADISYIISDFGIADLREATNAINNLMDEATAAGTQRLQRLMIHNVLDGGRDPFPGLQEGRRAEAWSCAFGAREGVFEEVHHELQGAPAVHLSRRASILHGTGHQWPGGPHLKAGEPTSSCQRVTKFEASDVIRLIKYLTRGLHFHFSFLLFYQLNFKHHAGHLRHIFRPVRMLDLLF